MPTAMLAPGPAAAPGAVASPPLPALNAAAQVPGPAVLAGTLADPQLSGTISLGDGVFVDAATGLRLEHMAVEANLKGESVEIGRLSASDGAKGSLSGSGVASLARDGASTFKISLKDFRLIDSPLGVASASGDITVNRASDGHARLSGDLVVDHAQISPKPPTPSGVVPMEVVEVNRPAEADEGQNLSLPPAPPVALDIRLRAPGGVIIKGRGLNLELSLDARVTGDTANPDLSGVARVVRGDYDFAGKRFQIDDGGSVHLASTPQAIRLDFSATRDDPTLTAKIQIQGTAAAPTLTLSSTPALPRDEILSQILFGSSAAQLSGFQAAQLASTLAGLASGGGFDVMGGLRNFAHLDRLAIDSGATTGVTVAGGKYLTNNIYVELSGGSRAGEGAQVEWRIKKHIALVSRATSQGDRVLSIRWRTDY